MHSTVKFSALCVLAITFVSVSFLGSVSAQSAPMDDEQISRIRLSCVSIKNTLNQLHASDALLRVNRGQMYESMSTKLMARFNTRVTNNHFEGKDLLSVARDYGTALTAFRSDYITYEVQLSSALSIDCSKEPVSFYDAVSLARTSRAQVHSDVTKLHKYIDDYNVAFTAFADKLTTSGAGK